MIDVLTIDKRDIDKAESIMSELKKEFTVDFDFVHTSIDDKMIVFGMSNSSEIDYYSWVLHRGLFHSSSNMRILVDSFDGAQKFKSAHDKCINKYGYILADPELSKHITNDIKIDETKFQLPQYVVDKSKYGMTKLLANFYNKEYVIGYTVSHWHVSRLKNGSYLNTEFFFHPVDIKNGDIHCVNKCTSFISVMTYVDNLKNSIEKNNKEK